MSKNNDIEQGFQSMAELLEQFGDRLTNIEVQKRVLYEGAGIIVNRAKALAPRGKTGNLRKSIGIEYNENLQTTGIGIGEPVSTTPKSTGFYGRFQETGFQPVGGRRVRSAMVRGRGPLDKRTKRRKGRRVQNSFIQPAYNAAQMQVNNAMFKQLQEEIKDIN